MQGKLRLEAWIFQITRKCLAALHCRALGHHPVRADGIEPPGRSRQADVDQLTSVTEFKRERL